MVGAGVVETIRQMAPSRSATYCRTARTFTSARQQHMRPWWIYKDEYTDDEFCRASARTCSQSGGVQGARQVDSQRYVPPFQASRDKEYACMECKGEVILKRGRWICVRILRTSRRVPAAQRCQTETGGHAATATRHQYRLELHKVRVP